MQITVTPKDVEKYQDYEQQVQDYPLYGHTSGLTKVDIVLLAKLLEVGVPERID